MSLILNHGAKISICAVSLLLTACNGSEEKLNVTVTNDQPPVTSTVPPALTSSAVPPTTTYAPFSNATELCQDLSYSIENVKKISQGYNQYSVELYKLMTQDLDK
ncbi:hypothetical protein, partial [Photobacterium swingsii]